MRRESKIFNTKQIRVLGIGGVGCSATNCLISTSHRSVQFIAVDTDTQALENSRAHIQIPLQIRCTKNLEKKEASIEAERAICLTKKEIQNAIRGSWILIIIAGLGGGTGSGGTPAIARIARSLGIFTIAVVTGPERSEGQEANLIAKKAIRELEKYVDNLMVLPTNHLMLLSRRQIALQASSQTFSDLLCQSVQVLTGFVKHNGLINLDLASLKSIMSNGGATLITFGCAKGKERARIAAERALFCPKLGLSIHGARGILIHVRASSNLKLRETETISNIIKNSTYLGADLVLGIDIDETLGDNIWISVIATGFFNENWEIGTNYEWTLPDELSENFSPPGNEKNRFDSYYTSS